MYYRLVDAWGEPYATSYNDTDLKSVAYWIWSLWDWWWAWDDEAFYWKTDEEVVEKIYNRLLEWERDLLYVVEEQEAPFSEDENPFNF